MLKKISLNRFWKIMFTKISLTPIEAVVSPLAGVQRSDPVNFLHKMFEQYKVSNQDSFLKKIIQPAREAREPEGRARFAR